MAGFDRRPVARTQLAELHALVNTIERFDDAHYVTSLEETTEWFDSSCVDERRDIIGAECGGELVGYARAYHRPSGDRHERVFLWGGVHPDHRRHGIGAALLAWAENRGREQLASCDPALPGYLFVEANERVADARALHAQAGFDEARWFIDMARPLDKAPAPSRVPGIDIVPWEAHHGEGARLASNAAFADHWGSTPRSIAAWEEELTANNSRLDLSFIALDRGDVVGFSHNNRYPADDAATGQRAGWIGTIGTLRSHRGRGIATALLRRSHRAFSDAGLTHAMLNVDAASPTGAGALYTREGYAPVSRLVMAQKQLACG